MLLRGSGLRRRQELFQARADRVGRAEACRVRADVGVGSQAWCFVLGLWLIFLGAGGLGFGYSVHLCEQHARGVQGKGHQKGIWMPWGAWGVRLCMLMCRAMGEQGGVVRSDTCLSLEASCVALVEPLTVVWLRCSPCVLGVAQWPVL